MLHYEVSGSRLSGLVAGARGTRELPHVLTVNVRVPKMMVTTHCSTAVYGRCGVADFNTFRRVADSWEQAAESALRLGLQTERGQRRLVPRALHGRDALVVPYDFI